MKQEVIFTDLYSLVNEKDRVSFDYNKNKWTKKEYEAGEYKGEMLITMETGFPDKVSFDLNLEGRYKIFVCLPNLRSKNYLFLKLTDDMCYTGVSASDRAPKNWVNEEFFEEIYWKTADLTGQTLTIHKPDSNFLSVAGIAWIRCVPALEDMPSPDNKCMQMHIDGDTPSETSFYTDDDYVMKLYQFKDTNVDFVSFEISFDYDSVEDPGKEHLLLLDDRWDKGNFEYKKNIKTSYFKNIEFAKKNNIPIYATNRMQVANFITPYTRFGWNMNFVENHPEFYMKTRTGRTVKSCSYAYPEVQDYVIKQFTDALKYGFNGISLIYHRGVHIGFEQPVIDRFLELYPDIDPYRLPISDSRLYGVWCSFMNEFMHKLRKAVGDDIKINVIANYSLKANKNLGLDLEYWAKNGLIDSASQADMEIYEDLSGCMSDENQEYIDLGKYQNALLKRTVLKRNFGTNIDKVCKNIPEYEKLKELYGIDVYHVLPWIFSTMPEEYPDIIKKMNDAGARKFLSWNTNHLVRDLPEWHTVKRIGNEPEREVLRKFHRVLSLDGNDISDFYPNWRG